MANNAPRLDPDAALGGFFLGMIVGGFMTLFRGPRLRQQDMQRASEQLKAASEDARQRLEALTPGDPISESIAEGKEAARRRRAELGYGEASDR